MDRLSEEEFAARLAYLQGQKLLAKAAADAAKQQMRFNDDLEQMRRHQKRPAFVDLTVEAPQRIKIERPHTPESETTHNIEESDNIQYNETPVNTPAQNGHTPSTDSVASGRHPSMSAQDLVLLDSDVANQQTAQPMGERKSSEDSTKKSSPDNQRFSQIVEDDEYYTITRALDGDALVELRCDVCKGNQGKFEGNAIRFFKGVKGFRGHIAASHTSSHSVGGQLTVREVLRRCTYRTLSREEKQSVINGEHGALKIERIMTSGADPDALIRAPRPTTTKLFKEAQKEQESMGGPTILARSTARSVKGSQHSRTNSAVQDHDSDDSGRSQRIFRMETRSGGKRHKCQDDDEDDDELRPHKALKKQENADD